MKTIDNWFCFPLKASGFIVGWLGTLALFYYLGLNQDQHVEFLRFLKALIVWDISNELAANIFSLIILAIGVTSVLLLIGVHRENEYLLMPWLIWNVAFIVLVTVISIPNFLNNSNLDDAFPSLVGGALLLGLLIYTWWAIYSLYSQFNTERRFIEVIAEYILFKRLMSRIRSRNCDESTKEEAVNII